MVITSIFMLFSFMLFIVSLLSIIFPNTFANFLPKKILPKQTRLFVFSRYFVFSVVCLIVTVIVMPKKDKEPIIATSSENVAVVEQQEPSKNNKLQKDSPADNSDEFVIKGNLADDNPATVEKEEPAQSARVVENIMQEIKKPIQNTQDDKVSADVEELKATFASLFDELMGFKNNKNFHKYGFGQGGAYYSWLERVRAADNKYKGITQIQTGLFFGELAQVGLDYMRSKGTETEYTSFTVPTMRKALGI